MREIGRGPIAENAREGLELLCLPRRQAKGCQLCRTVLDVTAARPHVGPAVKLGDLLVRAAFAEAPRSSATSQGIWPDAPALHLEKFGCTMEKRSHLAVAETHPFLSWGAIAAQVANTAHGHRIHDDHGLENPSAPPAFVSRRRKTA